MLLHTEGIDVNRRDDEGHTALAVAVNKGRYSIVKALLEVEVIETNTLNDEGASPLLLAMAENDESMVKLLLDSGKIDLTQQYEEKGITYTALAGAKMTERHGIVDLLVKAGAVE